MWVSTWLTAVTLLGLGTLMGLLILTLLWGLWCVVHFRSAQQVPTIVREGPLFPIFWVTAGLAVFGIVSMLFIVRQPAELLNSLARLPQTGEDEYESALDEGDVAPDADISEIEPQKLDIKINTKELVELRLTSDLNIDYIGPYSSIITESDRASLLVPPPPPPTAGRWPGTSLQSHTRA